MGIVKIVKIQKSKKYIHFKEISSQEAHIWLHKEGESLYFSILTFALTLQNESTFAKWIGLYFNIHVGVVYKK